MLDWENFVIQQEKMHYLRHQIQECVEREAEVMKGLGEEAAHIL